MTDASCPTAVVNAPVDIVWALLTEPAEWGNFFDVRIVSVEPPGPAVVGQRVHGESGPRLFHLALTFEYTKIDAAKHKLGLNVRLPFGITVCEDLDCMPLASTKCRVNYRCDFGFPKGWWGALMRLVMHRELTAGPADSLFRLKRAAEQRFTMNSAPRPRPSGRG